MHQETNFEKALAAGSRSLFSFGASPLPEQANSSILYQKQKFSMPHKLPSGAPSFMPGVNTNTLVESLAAAKPQSIAQL